jgi:hypothetical protein
VNFSKCTGLTGAVDKIVLPVGMQSVDFSKCTGLTGAVDKIVLPVGMQILVTMPPGIKEIDIMGTGVKIDVAAIEWPANATALVHDYRALVCRTTDPDESKEGAESSEIRIRCERSQVIGDLTQLQLPVGLKDLDLSDCGKLTGAVDQIVLPQGMQSVNFQSCKGLTGTLVTLPPSSMKMFDVTGTGVKIDVVAIEWPANATALVHDGRALVCRTTDPDESKEGAETSEIRIKGERGQVIGDLTQWHLPVSMKDLNLLACRALTGDIAQLNLPVGMQSVDFRSCHGITGDLTQWHLPVGMKDLNLGGCSALTGDITQLKLPVGMQYVGFFECTGLTGNLRQLHIPVGMKKLNLDGCHRLTGYVPPSKRAEIATYIEPKASEKVNAAREKQRKQEERALVREREKNEREREREGEIYRREDAYTSQTAL